MTWETALIVGAALMAAYLPLSLLLTLQVWEHRRCVRSSLRHEPPSVPLARAAVIVPVKGVDLRLKESLRSLLTQQYPAYEVHFVGEDQDDPAHEVVRQLIAEGPRCEVHWHNAGRAGACGQKVHNLLAACRQLPADVELIAFADSDASPGPHWLRDLAVRVAGGNPRIAAVTGYRVCVPDHPGAANWLLYAINSAVGGMLVGGSRLNLLWGGSWMIRREVFEQGRLAEAWEGTLSDDVVASSVIRRLGKRIAFEPRIMVPSATSISLAGLLEFVRRQFFMARHYSHSLWAAVVAGWTLAAAAFWINAGLAVCGAATASPRWWLPASLTAAAYLLGMLRARLRHQATALSLPEHRGRLRAAERFDLWAGPLATFVGWLGVIGSVASRSVTWRRIRYRLDRRGKVVDVRHLDAAQEEPADGSRRAA